MDFKYRLPTGYTIKQVENEEFKKLWGQHGPRIFRDNSLMYANSDVYTKKELLQQKKLRENFGSQNHLRINLGLFYKNKFVGWTWGFQKGPYTFYMCNSAVLVNHRQKGLYTCLMREMLKRVMSHGFDEIYSRHMITNNDILIAKLKQGFKITTFELSELFGTLVHLTYYPSKIKNDILDFRSGHKRPNKKLKKIFKLN